MNKTSVFTLVNTARWVTFPLNNWKQAPSVSDFANLTIWCNSNMANMGAHEKESDLAVWTLELVELVCFFKIYCKQQQQKQTITSMHSVCEQNDRNETLWLKMDFSLRRGRSPLTNIWELKQRRRPRQWERQKSDRFRLTKQQLAGASHFFVHLFFAVIARLRRENACFHVLWKTWTQEKTFFILSWTSIQSFRIQLQRKIANICGQSDKLFWWRFRSRCRYCLCLIPNKHPKEAAICENMNNLKKSHNVEKSPSH